MTAAQLREVFREAVRAADPYPAVAGALRREGSQLSVGAVRHDLDAFRRVLVVGAGKATAAMAAAAEERLGDRIETGLIVVKDGHTRPLRLTEQVEASHPVPDRRGQEATERLVSLLEGADAATLVLCLLSGGASSLLVAPAEGLTLEDKRATTQLLLEAGVAIGGLNAVRKHLSRVKGGHLAARAHPAPVVTLLVSDVIGDRLDVIASGPTVPDPTTYADALEVLRRAGVASRVPPAVAAHLRRGADGGLPETPKGSEEAFAHVTNHVVCSNRLALEAAAARARELGFSVEILTETLEGEARQAAHLLARSALARRETLAPGGRGVCLVAGGETTVTVRGRGRGGRNQELALAFALEIAGVPGIACLCAGTDGTDGPTDAAGAVVDGGTATAARAAGLDPPAFLADNDSHGFFERLDRAAGGPARHLKTGPTGTNVMDVVLIGIAPQGAGRGHA